MAFIDFVEWRPQGDKTIYAYQFPHTNLSTMTQLVVQESQEAVLFSKGQIVGKFGPGKHTLNTENLPLLRNLYGLPFGKKNPFTATVWFVNKVQPCNLDWHVDRMDVHDVDYNTGIPYVADGRYGLVIKDTERFLIKLVGTKTSYDQNDLTDQFHGEFSSKTKSTVVKYMTLNRIGLKTISAHLENISNNLKEIMVPFWASYGFALQHFYVTDIEVDGSTEVGRRVLDAISRQSAQAIGGYTWQQSQAFEMAKDAVDGMSNGDGGLLGAVVASNMLGGLGGGIGAVMQPQGAAPPFNNQGQQASSNGQAAMSNQPPVHEVYCANCSNKFTTDNRFCPHCGKGYQPCPKCGADNDEKASRCISCGTSLQTSQSGSTQNSCPQCGNSLPPGASFCSQCGTKIGQNPYVCSRCNKPLSPTTKFCPFCGQKNN